MTFDPVGVNERGKYYMKFDIPFTITEQIQLLQRSILVQSFAYYELNENILTDFQYDANARQLAELKKKYPDEYSRSRYYEYFKDFCSEDNGTYSTTGFDLLEHVRKTNNQLYRYLHMDAVMAIDQQQKRGVAG